MKIKSIILSIIIIGFSMPVIAQMHQGHDMHMQQQPEKKKTVKKKYVIKKTTSTQTAVKKSSVIKPKVSATKPEDYSSHTNHNVADTTHKMHNISSMDLNKNSTDTSRVVDHSKMNHDTTKMNHDMGNMKMNPDTMPINHTDANHSGHDMANMDMSNMSDPFSLNLPMERHGSGTGWLPDASPMFGYMKHSSKWMYMLHGNLFLRYNKQDVFNKGSRGDAKFDAPNWVMLMGQRKVGEKGLFHFSTMLSLDPLTMGGSGYPLLFQSGETFKGQPLVDRQHPHDLFSELSISYSHAFSKNVDAFIYLGYPGEPALGPIAFMHRPAALYNPDAPLSHHWSDATHITFGVATIGVRLGKVKVDASSFTGREPNEFRYGFDKPRFDSWSGRISYNPSENWSFQASQGFIKSPEELHGDEDVNRTTASAVFSNGFLNISGAFGLNKVKAHEGEKSVLLEGSKTFKRVTIYSRYEYVQKSVEELVLDETIYGHNAVFPVNALTLGINYDLIQLDNTRLSAGTQMSYYHADKRLNILYGKNPMAFEVYFRVYPSLMKKHKM